MNLVLVTVLNIVKHIKPSVTPVVGKGACNVSILGSVKGTLMTLFYSIRDAKPLLVQLFLSILHEKHISLYNITYAAFNTLENAILTLYFRHLYSRVSGIKNCILQQLKGTKA